MENAANIPVPPNLTNLFWRPIDQNNLEAIIDLSLRCYAVDGGFEEMYEPDSIKILYLPDEPCSGICAYTTDGHIAACASVSINGDSGNQRARIVGQVRPDQRRRGIGNFLMQWSQEQAKVLLAGVPQSQRVMEVETGSLTEPAHRLYQAHGFSCVHEELVMERDLHLALPERPLPQGVTILNWQPNLAEQFFQAWYASFRDRPGFPGYNSVEWIAQVTENDHKPEWSLLARVNDEPVGFTIGNINQTKDSPCGEIWKIGVIPTQRRRGLASALLVETMRQMQEDGASSANLTVNINNPGAIQAYSLLSFIIIGRYARYEQIIET